MDVDHTIYGYRTDNINHQKVNLLGSESLSQTWLH